MWWEWNICHIQSKYALKKKLCTQVESQPLCGYGQMGAAAALKTHHLYFAVHSWWKQCSSREIQHRFLQGIPCTQCCADSSWVCTGDTLHDALFTLYYLLHCTHLHSKLFLTWVFLRTGPLKWKCERRMTSCITVSMQFAPCVRDWLVGWAAYAMYTLCFE